MRNTGKIVALLALVVGLGACSMSCSHTSGFASHWGKTGDRNARYAQSLLDHTVKVDADMVVDARFFPGTQSPFPGGGMREIGWRGSGFVTDVVRKHGEIESLVVTAAHVCHIPDELPTMFGKFVVTSKKLTVLTIRGDELQAEVVYEDPRNDTCVLGVHGRAGVPVALADELPPVGAIVQHAGAPTGTYGDGLGIVNDGRYSGIEGIPDEDGKTYYYATITNNGNGGSSGGGVYYEGKVFGILVRSTESGHPTWCVELDHIRATLIEGRNAWARKNT